ncbi:hypothetical protein [Priestia megaterium]|nr:hypothetical protein [Priestia megaterium]
MPAIAPIIYGHIHKVMKDNRTTIMNKGKATNGKTNKQQYNTTMTLLI